MKRIRGFTLIEMMITVAVLGVILSFALPSLSDFIVRSRISAATSDLVADLAYARAEAARRGARVTVCGSKSAGSCDGDDFTLGWLVIADPDGDPTSLTTAEILRARQIDAAGASLSFTDSAKSISFRPTGQVAGAGGARTLELCKLGYEGRDITIEVTGRAAAKKKTDPCN